MTTHIYTLHDEAGGIRYVGKTTKPLHDRLTKHLRDARAGGHSHKANWIRRMLSAGRLPDIRLIEAVSGDGVEQERRWIKFFRESKLDLVNLTDGGEGVAGCGRIITPEHRAKISAALTGCKRSDTTKAKLREIAKRQQFPLHTHPHTQETKNKIKERLFDPVVRLKIGAANKGRAKTAKERQRMRDAAILRWSDPQERAKQAQRTKGHYDRTH